MILLQCCQENKLCGSPNRMCCAFSCLDALCLVPLVPLCCVFFRLVSSFFFVFSLFFFSIAPNSQIYHPQKKSNTTKVTTQAIKPFSLHLNWNGWRAEIGAFSLSLSPILYWEPTTIFSNKKRLFFFETNRIFRRNKYLFQQRLAVYKQQTTTLFSKNEKKICWRVAFGEATKNGNIPENRNWKSLMCATGIRRHQELWIKRYDETKEQKQQQTPPISMAKSIWKSIAILFIGCLFRLHIDFIHSLKNAKCLEWTEWLAEFEYLM